MTFRGSFERDLKEFAANDPELGQAVEAEDETGATWRFHGEAIAMAHLPSWPNNFFVDAVYRWEDDAGRSPTAPTRRRGTGNSTGR